MKNQIKMNKTLEKLAEEGHWDPVFYYLGIDPDGFFELPRHKGVR